MLYLKKKNFTMARDDRNGKLLPPNGNEEGLQRSECPIFTPIAKGKLMQEFLMEKMCHVIICSY